MAPTSLDPTADAAAAGSQVMLYNVYETLIKIDGEGSLRPLLAQAWELSEDGLTYTFKLNPAATFADGSPVDAAAVAANIERIQTEPVAAKLKTTMSLVASTEVVDPSTLEVQLTRPSNIWLYDMASTAGMIVDPDGFDALAEASAGSGPFAVQSWSPGDRIVLERNPQYWGTAARFDVVTFRYMADPNAMTAAMLAGELDVISNLQTPDALPQFSDTERFTVIKGTTNGEVVMGLNNGAAPGNEESSAGNGNEALQDLRVRQALTHAIDKQALVDTVWGGEGVVIGSMAVPTDPYYEDLAQTYPYDPDKARALLAEAGHSDLTLRLKPAAIPYASRSAQFIASQLEAVGVTVEVEELQFPARWLDVVYTNADYDATIIAHVEGRDLVTFTNPDYYWRYDNPELAALFAEADQADTAGYASGMAKASRLLAEDAAAIWLFNLPNIVITRAGISGVPHNATTESFDLTTMARA
ncbi:MAG: ABC transporter substrate-binding protein [Propioniciclava sp.]